MRGYEHEHVDQAARALLAGVTGQTVVRRLEGIGHAGVMDRARFGMKSGFPGYQRGLSVVCAYW